MLRVPERQHCQRAHPHVGLPRQRQPIGWGGQSRHQQQLLHSASASSASGVAFSCAAPSALGATLSECARDDQWR
eukprot:1637116-Lingulodinium_polyedra.AAC.1